ncbi:MAG: caspase family protein [Desulfobacteraceae bacterium]|nr:caspase family protein [Actinomycetota bacterium]MCG2755843.1 caspase family protein [Desulfobacteraceae bacterium]
MHSRILLKKKLLILLIALILSLALLSGCGGYPPFTPPISLTYLTGIVVQPNTMDLEEGESQYIVSVTAYYSDSSTANIPLNNCTYYSYNPSCATVNSSGLITGVSAGTTIILITYIEGTISKAATVEVTITQNEVVYRAYCVGVGDYINFPDSYGNIDLPGPTYDVNRVRQTLSQCRFGSLPTEFSEIRYTTDWSATKSAILQGIASIFSEADYNDVSYFYFSGHGIRFNNTSYLCPTEASYYSPLSAYISIDELENALSSIPGTKVVFLDSCHSGGFIGKGREDIIVSQEKLAFFNEDIINIFSRSESKSLLTTNQYKVLTSCHYYQECMGVSPTTPGDFEPFGVFTMALCEGCGYYSGSYPADTNLDTIVSLQEAYLYVKSYVQDLSNTYPYLNIDQDVQVYPNNSSFTIVEY